MQFNFNLEKGIEATELYSKINEDTILLNIADAFYPDGEISGNLRNNLQNILDEGKFSSYENFAGSIELRNALANRINRKNKTSLNNENILVTSGAVQGLLIALMALFNAGDELIVIDPSYNKNFTIPNLLSLKLVRVETSAEKVFKLPIEDISRSITKKTRGILITNPNNPTGRVYQYDELKALSKIVSENDLYVISDQSYEDMVFNGVKFKSFFTLPDMDKRTVTISSVSKGFALSGFRVGWIYSHEDIIRVIKYAMSLCMGSVNTLAQRAMASIIDDDCVIEDYKNIFERRRNYFYEKIKTLKGVSMCLPMAGYYAWIDASKLGTGMDVAKAILEQKNILVNPGTYYGTAGEGYIRVIYGAYRSDEKTFAYIDDIIEVLYSLERF